MVFFVVNNINARIKEQNIKKEQIMKSNNRLNIYNVLYFI